MNSRQGREGIGRNLPEPGAVQGHERDRQHHDRPQPQDQKQPLQQALRIGPPSARKSRHREYVEHIIDFLEIRPSARPLWASCPTACKSVTWPALAMEPQVLLLDEPMAGMNVEEKQDMSASSWT